MGNVKWIKITVDMFDDEKIKIIQSMPEGDAMLVIWIKMITLAGKTNDGGYVYIADNIPYTEEMLSVIMNKPLNTIRLALSTFISLGMIENDTKGIYLLNFEKHQSLDKMEKIKEQNRIRKQRERERKKLEIPENVTSHEVVTQCHATDIDKEIDKELDIKNKKKNKEYFAEANLNSIFIEFLEVRKKLKAVNSERAINTLLKTLNEHDDDTKYKMIENSIVNSWKSVFPLKDNKYNASNKYKREEIVPEWFNKDLKNEPMTTEDEKELDNTLNDIEKLLNKEDHRSNLDFETRKVALQKRLKEKYKK